MMRKRRGYKTRKKSRRRKGFTLKSYGGSRGGIRL